MLSEHTFDLSLIDLSLPDGNGFTICTEIKQQSKIQYNLPFEQFLYYV